MSFVDLRRLGLLSLALVNLFSCSLDSATSQSSPPIVIAGGTVIDGTPKPPQPNSVIVVRDGKIAAIGAQGSVEIPADAKRTNATGLYVTPGRGGLVLYPGADADIFLLSGNPLDNPTLLGSPMRTMRAGVWTDAPNQ